MFLEMLLVEDILDKLLMSSLLKVFIFVTPLLIQSSYLPVIKRDKWFKHCMCSDTVSVHLQRRKNAEQQINYSFCFLANRQLTKKRVRPFSATQRFTNCLSVQSASYCLSAVLGCEECPNILQVDLLFRFSEMGASLYQQVDSGFIFSVIFCPPNQEHEKKECY